MSWQGYVDSITKEGNACSAGIFGVDGSVWAKTPTWNVTQGEIASLVACAKNAGPQRDAAFGNGVRLAGVKFKTVRFEEDEIWKGAAKEPEEQAACAYVCGRCVLVGVAPGGHSASGTLNVAVERNHRHLKDAGY